MVPLHGVRRLAFIALLLTACRGGEGPMGPAGPQGDVGASGPPGPIGTANVISGRDTLTEADWSATTIQRTFQTTIYGTLGGTSMRYADIPVPAITQGVLDAGAVLVYATTAQFIDDFVGLPFRFSVASAVTYHRVLDFQPRLGVLRILYYHDALEATANVPGPLADQQPTRIFRWVIIPPAAGLRSALRQLPDDARARP